MIFVSAGTQFPFDRFIKIIDELARDANEEFVVQAIPGKYIPKHITLMPKITADAFNEYVAKCRLVVAHAGMGTILTSMFNSKPVVVFPRLGSLGEHRNDHQVDTAVHLQDLGYVYVAETPKQLRSYLKTPNLRALHTVGPGASPQLVGFVEDFLNAK